MKDSKYINSGGLAFSEQEDMKKLSEYAKDGWLLERFQYLGYRLKKGKPVHIEYELDYRKQPDEEYFAYFEEAGWTHVCSAGNEIHIFQAPKGTTPIHTDPLSLIEKYKIERKSMGKIALPTLICILAACILIMLGEYGLVPGSIGNISLFFGYALLIVLIFTGMPYVAYSYRLRKLSRSNG